jgi:hypothetical protein
LPGDLGIDDDAFRPLAAAPSLPQAANAFTSLAPDARTPSFVRAALAATRAASMP